MSVTIRPLGPAELPAALPLIAAYQRFYGVAEPDRGRNERFFARFLEPSEAGSLLGAWRESELCGFACLYFTFSSVHAEDVVLLNDLFVSESSRGAGVGRALIEHSAGVAAARGVSRLRWSTALDNRRAQALYERFAAERSAWFEYDLPVGGVTGG